MTETDNPNMGLFLNCYNEDLRYEASATEIYMGSCTPWSQCLCYRTEFVYLSTGYQQTDQNVRG